MRVIASPQVEIDQPVQPLQVRKVFINEIDTTANFDVGLGGEPQSVRHNFIRKGETLFYGLYRILNLEDNCFDSISRGYMTCEMSSGGKKWASIVPNYSSYGGANAGPFYNIVTCNYPVQINTPWYRIFVNSSSLQVGSTETFKFFVCNEPTPPPFSVRLCVGTNIQYFHVVPYNIDLVTAQTVLGTMHNICLKWIKPTINFWNIHHYAIFRNDTDSIRMTELNNCIKIADSVGLNDTVFTYSGGSRGIPSFYAIVGYDSLGEAIAISNSRKPDVPGSSFSLILPMDGDIQESINPVFSWETMPGASYELWISEDSLFSNVVKIDSLSQVPCSLGFPLEDHHSYFWKVMNNDSVFSRQTAWKFGINGINQSPGSFSLVYPETNTTLERNSVEFLWNQPNDPGDLLHYVFQIARDSVFSEIVRSVNITGNSYSPTEDLPEDTILFWHVIAIDTYNDSIISENINTLIISQDDPPGEFRCISPEISYGDISTQTNLSPVFTWSTSANYDQDDQIHYALVYSTDSTFSFYTVIEGLSDTTCTPLEPLSEDMRYYWKVKAYDNANHIAWSNGLPSCFVTNDADRLPGSFSITRPFPNQNINGTCNVTWTLPEDDLYDNHQFDLIYSQDSSFLGADTLIGSNAFSPPMGDWLLKVKCRSHSLDQLNPGSYCLKYSGYSLSNTIGFHSSDTVIASVFFYQSPTAIYTLESTLEYKLQWGAQNVNYIKIEYSTNGGQNWTLYDTNIPAHLGTIPDSYIFRTPNVITNNFLVRITSMENPRAYDISEKVTIIEPTKQISILYPNGQDSLKVGSLHTINWVDINVDSVNLSFSSDNGVNWSSIIGKVGGNQYNWIVPNFPSDSCLLRIQDYFYPQYSVVSDSMFTIYPYKIIHVSKLGNDSTGDGTPQLPFASIQRAVNIAKSYDTILVSGGQYDESINFPVPCQDRYAIQGGYEPNTWTYNPLVAETIIDAQNDIGIKVVFSSANALFSLADLTITHASTGINIIASDVAWTGENVILRRLEANHCDRGFLFKFSGFTLDQCKISDCNSGILLDRVYWKVCQITNSIFTRLAGCGIQSWDISWFAAFAADLRLKNNTFFKTNTCYSLTTGGYTASCLLENNIFFDNYSTGTISGGGITLTRKNNVFWANTVGPYNADSTNIFVDPLLADTSNDNFHLSDNSPCIGAGILNSLSHDHTGNLRPNPTGSIPDVGAHESELATPSFLVSSNSPVCQGTPILLTCSGGNLNLCDSTGNSFLWNGPNGFVSTQQNPEIAAGSPYYNSGKYVLIVTNNGQFFRGFTNVIINQAPTPTVTLSISQICQGSTSPVVCVTEPGMSSYTWSVTGGGIPNLTTGNDSIYIDWSMAPAGNQTVTVSVENGSGCSAETTGTITILTGPNPAIAGESNTCQNSELTLSTGTGMNSYYWETDGGNVLSGSGTDGIIVSWNTTGTKQVTLFCTDWNGCSNILPANKYVTVHSLPIPTISGTEAVCKDYVGNYYTEGEMSEYSWGFSSGGLLVSGGTSTSDSISIIWNSPGIQTVNVTYTDTNGCRSIDTAKIYVNVHPRPIPSIIGPLQVCAGTGSSTYFTDPGMYSYNWQVSSGGTVLSGGASNTDSICIEWDSVGSQTVNVTYIDSEGCSPVNPASQDVLVVPPVPVGLTINPSATVICEGTPVTFTPTPLNGGLNPVYKWYVNGINVYNSNITGGNYVDGLIASYPLNGNCDDVSGNGHHCTSYGATLTTDRTGHLNHAFQFDGVNDYLNTNLLDPFTNKATFSLWFQTMGDFPIGGFIISRNGDINYSGLEAYPGGIVQLNSQYTQGVSTNNGINYYDGNWHYVVGICSGTMHKIYIDGTLINQSPQSGNIQDMISYLIGYDANGSPRFYKGKMDEIQIYNRPLSLFEINWLYQNYGPAFSYIPNNGDTVYCQLISSDSCIATSPVISNAVVMTVEQYKTVTVSIAASANPVCAGTSVTFTATPVNGGSSPAYQWKVNAGNVSNATNATYTYFPVQGDVVTCQLTSTEICTISNPTTSNGIEMIITQVPGYPGTIYGPDTIQQGQTNVLFSIPEINRATGYIWTIPEGSTIISGNNTNTVLIDFSNNAISGIINVYGTNECGNGEVSANFLVTVTPFIPVNQFLSNDTVKAGITICNNASQNITVSGDGNDYIILNGGNVTLIAGEGINLLSGTIVHNGGYLHGYISLNGVYCNPTSIFLNPIHCELSEVAGTLVINSQSFKVYPNPTNGKVTIEFKEDVAEMPQMIRVYNRMGEKVLEQYFSGALIHVISLEDQPAGLYVIRAGRGVVKIVKL